MSSRSAAAVVAAKSIAPTAEETKPEMCSNKLSCDSTPLQEHSTLGLGPSSRERRHI